MAQMLAMVPASFARLVPARVPRPVPTPSQVLIRVAYAGVNRADLLQRAGKYPAPPGASDVMGLEVSGTVEISDHKNTFKKGDEVAALLAGGGWAEYAAVDAALCMPVTKSLGLEKMGAVPEAYLTAYQLLKCRADVKPGDTVLIHAAASGVGVAALQIALEMGAAKVIAIAGSQKKLQFLRGFADESQLMTFNRSEKTYDEMLKEIKRFIPEGVSVVLDCVGPATFDFHSAVTGMDARWVLFGTMSGSVTEKANMGLLLSKRISLLASTLRSRSLDYKQKLIEDFQRDVLPLLDAGKIKIIVDKVFAFETEAAEALEYVQSNANTGKVLLRLPLRQES